jgi:modulator of FtsH protease
MTENVQNAQTLGRGASSLAERNKVLRNTYWLLALSLLPTVLGAYIGVATGITAKLTGMLGMLVFMGGAFGFIFAIERTKNSAMGVPVLLGFTFFMGLMLSRMIGVVLGFSNGASLVMTAFAGTAGVMLVMASLATVIKRDLSGMSKWLFAVISTLAIAVFSAYLLYDLKQVVDGGETNYISATLVIYLDLFNIFQSLLALLGIFGGERD